MTSRIVVQYNVVHCVLWSISAACGNQNAVKEWRCKLYLAALDQVWVVKPQSQGTTDGVIVTKLATELKESHREDNQYSSTYFTAGWGEIQAFLLKHG